MNKNRAAKLLASGLRGTEVASIMGVSPARISQLHQEEEFKVLLSQYAVEAEKEDAEEVALTVKYLTAEHALVNKVIELTPICEMRDALSALKVVSDRQVAIRKQNSATVAATQGTVINNHISLQLPVHLATAIPNIQITGNREIIAIGDKNLAPLSSKAVTTLFQSLQGKGDNHDTSTSPSGEDRSSQEALSPPSTPEPVIQKEEKKSSMMTSLAARIASRPPVQVSV